MNWSEELAMWRDVVFIVLAVSAILLPGIYGIGQLGLGEWASSALAVALAVVICKDLGQEYWQSIVIVVALTIIFAWVQLWLLDWKST